MKHFSQEQFSEYIKKHTQSDNSFFFSLEEGFKVEGVIEIKNKSSVRIENGTCDRLIVSNNTKVELVNVTCKNLEAGDTYEAIERITIHGGQFQEANISVKTMLEIEKEAEFAELRFNHAFPKKFNINSKKIKNINFSDINFNNDNSRDWIDLMLPNSGFELVILENCNFNKISLFAVTQIKLINSTIVSALRFVSPNVYISSSRILEGELSLWHGNSKSTDKIYVDGIRVNVLNINNYKGSVNLNSVHEAKFINLSNVKNTHLHKCYINYLSYSGEWITKKEDTPPTNYNLEISHSNINTVNRIEGVTFDRFIVLNSKIKEGLTIHSIHVDEKFELVNLGLERSTFNNLDLSNCKEINFKYTLFKDCNFNSIQWPSGFLFHRSEETNLKPHIEAYRQIKKVYESQNNTIEAERFKRSELEVYLQDLKTQRFSDDFPWVKNEFWDYCIIWTYKIFGGYGLKLWNVIFWSIIFHTLLFLLFYSFNTEIFSFKPFWVAGKLSFEQTLKAFSTYVYFANPVHSFKYEGNDIYSLWDTLIRISSAFFIFYFLKISRKFT